MALKQLFSDEFRQTSLTWDNAESDEKVDFKHSELYQIVKDGIMMVAGGVANAETKLKHATRNAVRTDVFHFFLLGFSSQIQTR